MNPTEHVKLLSEIEVFRLSFGEQWSAYFNHNTNSIQFLLYLANSHKEQQPFGRVEFSEIVQFEFNHCLSQYRGNYDQLWNEFITSILNCVKAVEQCSKAKEHVSNILSALQNMPKLKECILINFNETTVTTLYELFTIDIHSSLSSTPRSFTPDISVCSVDDVTVTPADTVTKKMRQLQIQQNGTYKAIIKMTLRCLQIFPCLLSIPMDSVVISNYFDALVSEEYWAPAVSVIKLYPPQISYSSVASLLKLLVAAKEWEVAVDLVLHFFLSSGSGSSGSVSNNVFSTLIHTKLSAIDTRDSVSAAAADRHASNVSSNGLLDSDNAMSNVSAETISSMADRLVSDCLEENTNASLKAAGRVAEALRNNDLIAQIKFLAQKLKFVGFVKKGKWQLILQTVYAKGLDAQRCLYECLLEDGQYIEAKIVYSRFTSLAHFKVPPVPPDLVEKQLQFKRNTYMRFPAEKVKIVVVNNYDTLTYAAEVLGISLAAVSANNNPSSSNKSVQSSLLALHTVLNIRPTVNSSSSSGSGMNINSGVMSGSDVAVSRTLNSMTALRFSQVVTGICGDNATVSNKDNTVSQTAATETPVVRMETSTLDATSTELNSLSSGSRSRHNSSSSVASTDSKDPSPTKRQRRPRKPNDVTAASSSSSSNSSSVSDASKYAAVAAKSINDVLVNRRNAPKTSSVAPNIDRFRLLVGLDSEWKVVMYGGGTESLGASILQIASPDHAFIFDLNALGKAKNSSPTPTAASNNRHNCYNSNNGNNNFRYQQQNTGKFSGGNNSASTGGYSKPAAYSSQQKNNQQQSMSKQQPHMTTGVLPLFEMTELFLYRLFADKGVLKVGWGFMNEDCKMIRKAANGRFGQVLNRIESFVDLDDVVTKEDMQLRVKNIASGEECSKSLSNACQRYLGRPLDKFEQLSDWDAQPLSLSQQQYASLDAHSLLGILDAMLLEKQITSPLHIATALYGASNHVQESIMLLNSGNKK